MNANGTLVQGGDFPKGVTGVSHTTERGIYCIGLDAGIDPTDAAASLTSPHAANGVSTVPNSTDCAAGQAQVDTFILVQATQTPPAPPSTRCSRTEGSPYSCPNRRNTAQSLRGTAPLESGTTRG